MKNPLKKLWRKLFQKNDQDFEPVDIMEGYRLGVGDTGTPYIQCLRCSMISCSAADVDNKYCGFCRKYHARVVYDYQ